MEQKIKELSKENLQEIILNLTGILSKEQCEKLEEMIDVRIMKMEKIGLH